MLWFVCRKIGLFPAILHRKNVFRQFAASHFDFYLIFLKTSVSVYFRGSYAVFSIMFSRTTFSFFLVPILGVQGTKTNENVVLIKIK